MAKYEFQKIFGWICWVSLLLLGGWAGLFVIDILSFGTRNVAILVIFAALAFFTFAVDSLMKEHPEEMKSYFIKWLLVCGMFAFFALSAWVWF